MKTFTVKNYDFYRPSLFFTVLEVTVEKGEGRSCPDDGQNATIGHDDLKMVMVKGQKSLFLVNL